MREISYLFTKIKYKFRRDNKEVVSSYFRKSGMRIGKNCNICCNIMPNEPYLVEIGDNVTISGSVIFITHDNSISKIYGNGNDLFGRIIIGSNSFIGQNSTILYGVTIPDNTIVAAGSVVTNSYEQSGLIIGGNPAHIIGKVEDFFEKNKKYIIFTKGKDKNNRMKTIIENQNKLIERKMVK